MRVGPRESAGDRSRLPLTPIPMTITESPVSYIEFEEFPKIARLSREVIITEKIDGTNAQICITEDGKFLIGSRTRWITTNDDNHGFARWAMDHRDELMTLGVGRHFGEWWGSGIQRGYGLPKGEKRWSLFNVSRWDDAYRDVTKFPTPRPACCHVVPTLGRGIFQTDDCDHILADLKLHGSWASPGFMRPEGIVIFHTAANVGFKKTIEKDDVPKSLSS